MFQVHSLLLTAVVVEQPAFIAARSLHASLSVLCVCIYVLCLSSILVELVDASSCMAYGRFASQELRLLVNLGRFFVRHLFF